MKTLQLLIMTMASLTGAMTYAQSDGTVADDTKESVSIAEDGSGGDNAPSVTAADVAADEDTEALRLKAEIAQAEAEKARAEAEKARAEAELAKAEAQKAEAAALSANASATVSGKTGADAQTHGSGGTPPDAAAQGDETQPNHRGFFSRVTPGLGLGLVWAAGTMDPRPGLEAVDDPSHVSLTGAIGVDMGGGIAKNLALHIGGFGEKMFMRQREPAVMAFSIFGIAGGLTWYFTKMELFLTGQFRWVGMLVKFPQVSCSDYFEDTFDWFKGPGLSLTFGREWFQNAKDQRAPGMGIQANYYRMKGGNDNDYHFNYFSLLLVLTFTRF